MLHSRFLFDTIQLATNSKVLILNSAADPFVPMLAERIGTDTITLAEDNVAALHALHSYNLRHIPFHEYTLSEPPETMDIAMMNILYQPSKAWIEYGLYVARYALVPGGRLYVVGAKDRGILSTAKRMQEQFGNVETLAISKGHRVLCSRKASNYLAPAPLAPTGGATISSLTDFLASLVPTFASGELDEGTRLLLEMLEVHSTDEALDIGCGAGFIGLHVARKASKGYVTMVDASLAAVAVARQRVAQSGLTNITILPSDGAQAVLSQRFDLVVTNPPFHIGGIQTTEIAERFIREAAQVLRPRGRFYLVANRFLKYEPTLRACFKTVEEVGGNTRYKVLRGLL